MQRQNLLRNLITATSLFVSLNVSFADHPNEGKIALDEYISEAISNNLDLKKMEHEILALQNDLEGKASPFYPKISLEAEQGTKKINSVSENQNLAYAQAEWNLYNGGMDQASYNSNKLTLSLLEKKKKALTSKVVRDVSHLYYELLFLLESISLKEKSLSMNNEQMKMAVVKKNSGFTSSTDVIEFELRESTIKSDLKLLQYELEAKSREMSLLLGRKKIESSIELKGHLEKENIKIDFNKIKEQILSKNIDLSEKNNDLNLLEQDKKIIRSEYLPKVSVEAKYGRISEESDAFDSKNDSSVFVKISVPLFDGLVTKNKSEKLESQKASVKVDINKTESHIISEFENTVNLLNSLGDRINLEEKNLTRSEEYYKITLAEYKRGVKNSPDVVEASERLLDTRIRNLEYRRDLKLAKLKLYELTSSDPKNESF